MRNSQFEPIYSQIELQKRLEFWSKIVFILGPWMENLGLNNRVVQGDRVIEERVIDREYCSFSSKPKTTTKLEMQDTKQITESFILFQIVRRKLSRRDCPFSMQRVFATNDRSKSINYKGVTVQKISILEDVLPRNMWLLRCITRSTGSSRKCRALWRQTWQLSQVGKENVEMSDKPIHEEKLPSLLQHLQQWWEFII